MSHTEHFSSVVKQVKLPKQNTLFAKMDKIKGIFTTSTDYESQTDENSSSQPTNAANTPQDTERGFIGEALDASTLSYGTRVKGFTACFVLGLLLCLLGCALFAVTWSLAIFGVLYTLGNCCAIGSTLFLMGPVNQIKRMFNKDRWIASTAMIAFLLLTLISAFVLQKKGLTILFVIFQFLAMTWYALSYIPFARDAVKKFFGSIIG